MAFPISHIKATNLTLTDAQDELIRQKLSTLEKFIGNETDITCDIELQKTTGSQSGDIFRAEANVYLKGKLFRAEATTDQIEKSIDGIRSELERELHKAQDKSQTLMKRGGAMIKNMMRFGR